MTIHQTAIIDSDADIADGVEVGPYAVIGAGVRIATGCRIGPHAHLEGPLEMGEGCAVGTSSVIGLAPQTVGDDGPGGATRIGPGNVFREFSQVHRSRYEDGTTVIGARNYFMAGAHVAHDCILADDIVMVNNTALAGHVEVESRAFFGGGAMIHHFVRIGRLAMIGGYAGLANDAPPFSMVQGIRPAVIAGLNMVGLRRAGVSMSARRALKAAFTVIFRTEGPMEDRLASLDADETPEVRHLVEFMRKSERGVLRMARGAAGTAE